MNKNMTDEEMRQHPKFEELMDMLQMQSPEQMERLRDYLQKLWYLPPCPPKEGHKFVISKSKISAMIDPALLEFLEEARKSFNVSMSRMIEACIWEYFGRPVLSFQKGDIVDGESDQHLHQAAS